MADTTGRAASDPPARRRQGNWRSQNAVEDQPHEDNQDPPQEDEVAGNF